MTAVETLRPTVRRFGLAYDAACVVMGSLVIAALAQVAIPLPFSPVPITGQTMAALLVGILLGPRLGLLAVLVYLAEGTVGLPVFAGGAFGPARLLGPTGGYLVGLALAALLTGWLAERGWDRRPLTTLLAMLFGSLVIYACGAAWLAHFVGNSRVLALGVLPFIPGDLLKIAAVTALLPAGWALLGKDRRSGTN